MSHEAKRRSRIWGIGIGSAAAIALMFGAITRNVGGEPAAMKTSPAMKLVSLGMKFNGSGSCAGSGCHNKAGDKTPPPEPLHELTIWKKKDLHAKAYANLNNAESKAIAAALKIPAANKSAKCLSCHALDLTASPNLKGAAYNINEGNTCESCHGPSEKWLAKHADKAWQDQQRATMTHDQLLTTMGLYDTRPVVVRAELCASCHLAIDADLVEAKHPATRFDVAYLSDVEPKHWAEKPSPEGFKEAKIWVAGQAVGTREAMQQLSDRAKAKAPADAIGAAWQQALAHAMILQPAAGTIGLDAAGIKTHADALDKLTPADTDKIATEADAIVKICAAIDAKKVEAWNADEATTKSWLAAVGGMQGMGKKYGQFGVDLQAMSITSLYSAQWNGANKKKNDDSVENDAKFKAMVDKLFPEKAPAPADFDKNVADAMAAIK